MRLALLFNIGKGIALTGFELNEVKPLILGLEAKCHNPQNVLKEILSWTGGQPLLTQLTCQLIRDSDMFISSGSEAEIIQDLIQTQVVNRWNYQDNAEHFKAVRDRLIYTYLSPQNLLLKYQKILHKGEIAVDDSAEITELLLSGLVRNCEGKLRIYNRIYQNIFNEEWVTQSLKYLAQSK
ncbi:MAG: hypothetical protein HC908_18780 [Calothrix sp. SM1_7_51]|nr:hypothetical protein [Calothrix sp. SM1_7_51]